MSMTSLPQHVEVQAIPTRRTTVDTSLQGHATTHMFMHTLFTAADLGTALAAPEGIRVLTSLLLVHSKRRFPPDHAHNPCRLTPDVQVQDELPQE